MEDKNADRKPEKQVYEPPKVVHSYTKEEIEDAIRPHGPVDPYACGCGG